MRGTRARRWTAAVLLVGLAAGACDSGGDRPAADDWEPVWVRTEALLPDAAALSAGDGDPCGEALGEVRASRQEVLPAPTSTLDERVEAWLAAAEGLLFECPHDPQALSGALDELDRLAGLVTANLQTTRQ